MITLKHGWRGLKMKDKINSIYKATENTDGIIRTSEIEKLGIGRYYLSDLVEQGVLVRESHGIYSVSNEHPDEYYLIQIRSNKLVFSYGTALFFHGLSDRVPHIIDVTLPQGYNASRLKKTYQFLRIHYVQQDFLNYEIEEIITPQGYKVRAYSKERCICELIKKPNSVDKQIYIQAIRQYFKEMQSFRKLLTVAKAFGVEKQIHKYLEVL